MVGATVAMGGLKSVVRGSSREPKGGLAQEAMRDFLHSKYGHKAALNVYDAYDVGATQPSGPLTQSTVKELERQMKAAAAQEHYQAAAKIKKQIDTLRGAAPSRTLPKPAPATPSTSQPVSVPVPASPMPNVYQGVNEWSAEDRQRENERHMRQ